MSETYSVLSPEGRSVARAAGSRPTFDDLSQVVIGELWDYGFRGDEVFAVVREILTERYPGVRFVGYEKFGDIHGPDEHAVVAALPQRLRDERCNAVLAGVGA